MARTRFPALAAAVVAAGSLAMPLVALAAPVLSDASFENPALPNTGYGAGNNYQYQPTGTGWTYSTYAGVSANGGPFYSGNAPDGVQAAFIQNYNGSGMASISQVVSGLLSGRVYNVVFFLASRSGYGINPVNVKLGGVDLGTYTNTAFTFVKQISANYTATGTTAALALYGVNVSGFDNDVAVDAVSVNEVPEPASMALLGLATVAALAVRRRRTAA